MKESTVLFFRGLYKKLFHPPFERFAPVCEKDKDKIQKILSNLIMSKKPFMAARLGSIELSSLENALYMKEKRSNWRYISWKGEPSFFHRTQAESLCNNAGFFPYPTEELMFRFLSLMQADMKEVDVLGSWRYNEECFKEELKNAVKVDREEMTPLLCDFPWSAALEGKKVLVVHPFSATIEQQYARRELLYPNSNILPCFELHTLKAVQSAAGEKTSFSDWFEALQYMKDEIDKVDYDICLLGCGAYGFPLAAHCKRRGKQAIHLGGVLQLLFGIKGRRWENESVYLTKYRYLDYYNDYWVRPSDKEVPSKSNLVENGCYW